MISPNQDGPRGRGRGRGGFAPGAGGPGDLRSGGGRYRRSVLEVAILSSLAEAAAHGYNLVDQIRVLIGDLVCIDAGSMYRLLRAMEEAGLVNSSWHTAEAGPRRRVYAITEQGIEALESMAASLSQRAAAMQELAEHTTRVITKARSDR